MLKHICRLLIGSMVLAQLTVGIALCLNPRPAWAATDPIQLGKAVQAIENLDQMRSSLASTLEGHTEEPTLQTMKEVCRPVGMQVVQLSQENGWQVKQLARNTNLNGKDDRCSRLNLAI